MSRLKKKGDFVLKDVYDLVASRENQFDEVRNPKNEWVNFISALVPYPGKKILEIGCAEGNLSIVLAEKGNEVIGVDISSEYIKRARSKISNTKTAGDIKFKVVNIDKEFPFKTNDFDVVVMTEVLEHLESPFVALKKIRKLLRPKGILVISVPNSCSPANFLRNLLKFRVGEIDDLHLQSYDHHQIIKLLRLSGFTPTKVLAHKQSVPKFGHLPFVKYVSRLVAKLLPQISEPIIVVAKKQKFDFDALFKKWV